MRQLSLPHSFGSGSASYKILYVVSSSPVQPCSTTFSRFASTPTSRISFASVRVLFVISKNGGKDLFQYSITTSVFRSTLKIKTSRSLRRSLSEFAPSCAVCTNHQARVYDAINSFPPGSFGGLDGIKPQHLKDLIAPSNGETAGEFSDTLIWQSVGP